ncbi:hypothetical protein HWV62_25886 [Athelia sp. TMB]|nr:hypothetical protein HWV62_25886 [Athelia sp. TMB]
MLCVSHDPFHFSTSLDSLLYPEFQSRYLALLDTTPFSDRPIIPLGSLGATTLSGSFSLIDPSSFVVTGGDIHAGPIFRPAESFSWIKITAWICDDHDFSTFRSSIEFSLDSDMIPPTIIIPHALGLLKPLPFLFCLTRFLRPRLLLRNVGLPFQVQVQVEVSVSILEGQAGDFDEDERSSLESMAFTASVDHVLLLFPDLNDSGISINSDSTVGSLESSDGVEAESDENSVQLGYTSSIEDLALRPPSSSTFMEDIVAELELALEGHF